MSKCFTQENARVVVKSDSLDECQQVVDDINYFIRSNSAIALKMNVINIDEIHRVLKDIMNVFGRV